MRRAITVCAAILVSACSPLPPEDGTGGSTPGQVGGAPGGGNGGQKKLPDLVVNSQWTNVTANLAHMSTDCSAVTMVSPKPDEDMLIAGVAARGLFASVNGSETWVQLGQGPGSAQIENRPASIVYDPDHPATFWESGIYGGGVFRTTDNGNTFVRLGDAEGSDTVSVDFTDPERKVLMAASHERVDRLLRSIDGGATWTDIGPNVHNAGYASQPIVLSTLVHLLVTEFQPGAGVYRTTDGGVTWARMFDAGFRSRMLSLGDTFLFVTEGDRGVAASTDKGVTWTLRGGSGLIANNGRAEGLLALPDGRLVSINRESLLLSADGGFTWRRLTPVLPFEPWGFTYSVRRKAFYTWYFSCDMPAFVPDNAIARLEFDYQKQ